MSKRFVVDIHLQPLYNIFIFNHAIFSNFIILQNIYASHSELNEAQKRVVHKYLLEARLNGIELSHDNSEAFTTKLRQLELEKDTFRRKVAVCMHMVKPQSFKAFYYNCHNTLGIRPF